MSPSRGLAVPIETERLELSITGPVAALFLMTERLLSLSAVVKHLKQGEHAGIAVRIGGRPDRRSGGDPQAAWLSGFSVGADESVPVLLERWDDVARETEEVVRAEPDLDRVVPLAGDVAQWMPAGTVFTVRWMLLHHLEESARHAGHADSSRREASSWAAASSAGSPTASRCSSATLSSTRRK